MSALQAAILFFSAAAFMAAQDGTVRSGGQPIPGAVVAAAQGDQKLSTVTDENGKYHFANMAPGDWDFSVEIFGFTTLHKNLRIIAAPVPTDWELQIQARPRPATQTRRQGGFQSVTLSANAAEAQQAAEAAPEPAPVQSSGGDANESFLVNGSLAQGLGQARPDDPGMGGGPRGPFGGGPSGFDPNNPGGVPGAPQIGGGGRGPGGGGPGGGGPGGFAGGFGGGRGGPGGGGPGGRGGGGDRRGRGPGAGTAAFGNRARRGRDGLHGSAFFQVGNSAVNAHPYSLTGQDIVQPAYGSARFGLSAGGPLVLPHIVNSPKTFFFLNYTGTRSRAPYSGFSTLPTLAERAGDFSQAFTRFGPVQIYDPTSHQPFANNVIPTSRLDPTALKLLSFIPTPNLSAATQNYQILRSYPSNTENLNLRINRTVTTKDAMDANINLQQRQGHNIQLYGFTDEVSGLGISVSVGDTHTFSKTFLDSFHFNFSRNRSTTVNAFAYGANIGAAAGINGTSTNPINYGPPNLSFTNFGGLTDASPTLSRNQTAGVTDGFTWVHGRHTMTFGGEYRRSQINLTTDSNGRGSFSFSGLLTSGFTANGLPVPNTGYDFADFLLGLPQSSSVRFGNSSNYFRGSVTNAYINDDYRLRSGITLNIGLRYEYYTPYTEKYGHLTNLDVPPGFVGQAVEVLPGQSGPYTGAYPNALIDSYKKAFSPRGALAWKLKKNTVLRAGYSIFYNGAVYAQFPTRLASQPPFATTASLVTSVTNPLTIENGFAASPSEKVTNTFAIDRAYEPGYIQTWNFNVQQTLPSNFIIELGYMGTKGTRLDIQSQPNRALAGSYTSSNLQISNATPFTYETSVGNSIYHALQVRFNRRFVKGISWQALYTFSKSIDDASSIGGGGTVVAQNAFDLSAERGLSSFNRTHTLTSNFIFTSPFAENGVIRLGTGWKENLLKDWTLSGGATFSSGAPFTAQVLGNQANAAGTGSVGSGRAEATGLPIDSGNGFFNLSAFTIPVPGTFGNAGRNTIIGPSSFTLNLSFGRSFRLRDDRRRLEFRVEGSNIMNSVNVASINAIVNATNYGLPTSAAGMRSLNAVLRLRF